MVKRVFPQPEAPKTRQAGISAEIRGDYPAQKLGM
jgi:hypothetical protein